MHTMIHPMTSNDTSSRTSRIAKSAHAFRNPHYDCQYDARSIKLVVYVPGVVASGVDITMHGPDLSVTARKDRPVRANWTAAQLELAQHDYLLRLRIGNGYNAAEMSAELDNGVLTITVPKLVTTVLRPITRMPRLAEAAA